VLAAEHLLDLGRLHLRLQLVEPARELVVHGFALLEPLEDDAEVVGGLVELAREVDVLLEAAAPLQDLLRFGLVLPEVGGRDLVLEPGQLLGGTCGLKDNSAGRRRASRGPGNGGSGRPD
jgi:hypothetical protein